jgi:A/G-specific adenine glycosylase
LVNKIFYKRLINWYLQNKRGLPWRETAHPYPIWVSEIILQQTRVAQGLPYFHRFMERFPTVEDLANADEEEVLRLWQGLGYYSRARNLHACAQAVVCVHGGLFPSTFEELKKLPGIGPYTAAAIASFAFKEVVPVVDGNVLRVLSRLMADDTDIAHSSAHSHFFNISKELISPEQPDIFNQAIMELGALVCTPYQPLCGECPVKDICQAHHLGLTARFPVKSKKTKSRPRYLEYFVLSSDEKLWMRKRPKGDIWTGLYDFWMVEFAKPASEAQLMEAILSLGVAEIPAYSASYQHVLSHQKLQVRFSVIEMATDEGHRLQEKFPELRAFSREEILEIPKPVLVSKFLNDYIF